MFVIGYPKSGNTWLSYLLSYCLNSEYDDYDEPGIHPRNEYQRKYVKGGFKHTCFENKVGKIKKAHFIDIPSISEPIAYIVRDGRDVLVSYYYFKKDFLKEKILDFPDFVNEFSVQWANHVKKYTSYNLSKVIKYEDLSNKPEHALTDFFKEFNINIDNSVILKAIDIFSFQKLSNRKKGDEERNSFFRKGVVGDWKNHFDTKEIELFNNNAVEVMESFEY